jgi:enoyl-CoA hydratase/carnithine racemase
MAMQMLMTGEPISAQEAYRLGMVNQVTSQSDLMRVTAGDRREDRAQFADCGAGSQVCSQVGARAAA